MTHFYACESRQRSLPVTWPCVDSCSCIACELRFAPGLVMKMAVLLRCFMQQQEREVQTVLVSLHLKLSDKLPLHCKFSSKLVVTRAFWNQIHAWRLLGGPLSSSQHKFELLLTYPPRCMSLGSGRKLDSPGRTNAVTGKNVATPHRKTPGTIFLTIW